MNDFFTWGTLGTMAGATAAVTLATEFVKWITGNKVSGWGIRAMSFSVALVAMFLAPVVDKSFSPAGIPLYMLNAAIVTLASNGLYDGAKSLKKE